ncbi:hypothetical protein B0J11DRAFT_604289 [Dendryphion nanum]|uniref:NACHT domain-containing protein n=1 Tax=Dendryphion nanum TaxID=256645 RepID=A0A9P9DWA0_9PLEO|nr:hypothetical protein B0J11DRAFT_604289 [Dendryphion nanum]
MEALAAYGLACNVMQTIQFGAATVKLCKRLYDGQSPDPHMESRRAALQKTTQDLHQSLSAPGSKTTTDGDLRSIADKLLKTSADLEKELAAVTAGANASKRTAFKKTFKFVFSKKSKIEELDASLKESQRAMETRVLVDLRVKLNQNHADLTSGFSNVDKQLQDFLQHLKQGHTKLEQLIDSNSGKVKDVVVQEAEKTRTHVDADGEKTRAHVDTEAEKSRAHINTHLETVRQTVIVESTNTRQQIEMSLNEHRSLQDTVAQVKTLLQSLYFDEMNMRKNAAAINESHGGTFQWIFGDDPKDEKSVGDFNSTGAGSNRSSLDFGSTAARSDGSGQDFNSVVARSNGSESELGSTAVPEAEKLNDFIEWFQSDDKIFWITGKPGSGKSSLIRFLTINERTQTVLKQWSEDAKIVSSFIWNAGHPLQRSQVGLLASLLYQLLSTNEQVAEHILKSVDLSRKRSISDWSRSDLLLTLVDALKFHQLPICLFIDGLDEIDAKEHDGPRGLIKLINTLESLPNVKLCLGSRDELIFRQKLRDYPQLRMQDLTQSDMEKFVSQTLVDEFDNCATKPITPDEVAELTRTIISKADGVFLWVHVVTKTIQQGLFGADDWDELSTRVSQLPQELTDLYSHMWKRFNDNDLKLYGYEAAIYFRMVMENTSLSLFRLMLCADAKLVREFLAGGGKTKITNEYLVKKCLLFRQRLLIRSAGLLEVSAYDQDAPLDIFSDEHSVSFIHRSARDFLTDTADGQKILNAQKGTWADVVKLRLPELVDMFLVPNSRTLEYKIRELCYLSGALLTQSFDREPQLELPLLNLFASILDRIPFWRDISIPFVFFAAQIGSLVFVKDFLEDLPADSSPNATWYKNEILRYACNGLYFAHWEQSPKRWCELISWLLEESADPNLLPTSFSGFNYTAKVLNQSPFITFLLCLREEVWSPRFLNSSSQLRNQILDLLALFLSHGADTSHRIIVDFNHGFEGTRFGKGVDDDFQPWHGLCHLYEIDVHALFKSNQHVLLKWIKSYKGPETRKKLLQDFFGTQHKMYVETYMSGRFVSRTAAGGTDEDTFFGLNEQDLDGSAGQSWEWKTKTDLAMGDPDQHRTCEWVVEKWVREGYLTEEVASAGDAEEVVRMLVGPNQGGGEDWAGEGEDGDGEKGLGEVDWGFREEFDELMGFLGEIR